MMAYPEYKATGLHWLPRIPKHWDWLFLSQISEEQKIKNIAAKEKNVLSLSYGNIIRKKNLNGGLTPQDWATYQIVFPGNIILRLTDLQNDHTSLRTGLVKEQGIITSAYTCVKTSHNSAFLHYLLHAYDIQKVFYGFGGGVRQSIGYKALRNLCFPVPAPDEQAQIVRYLDAMTAKINKLIRAKKKQIALLQEQKQAIINQAVTQGLDPNVEMKDSGIDWLGKIPKHWKMPRLAFLTKKIGSGKTPRGGANIYSEEGVMFVRSQNVYFNELQIDNIRHITDEINNTMPGTQVKNGDVLLNITGGSIGRCCVFTLQERANVNQHVCIIRCNDKAIIPEYLAHVLFSNIGQEYIKLSQNAGNRESLTFVQVGAFPIPLPSLHEQKKILSVIHEKTNVFDKCTAYLSKTITLSQEAKQSYVSAVVTGKMDVRGLAVEDVLPEDMPMDEEEAGEDVEEEMTEAESED